mmetsp:Transcript_13181/g.22346  ORF Transcript_13181/g.22346 Transcript_13181/m.22346 type:complete len:387 (-) Transcript_13181:31-1191(-)
MDDVQHCVNVGHLGRVLRLLHLSQDRLGVNVLACRSLNGVRLHLDHEPLEETIPHVLGLGGGVVSEELLDVHGPHVALQVNGDLEEDPEQLLCLAPVVLLEVVEGLVLADEGLGDAGEDHNRLLGDLDPLRVRLLLDSLVGLHHVHDALEVLLAEPPSHVHHCLGQVVAVNLVCLGLGLADHLGGHRGEGAEEEVLRSRALEVVGVELGLELVGLDHVAEVGLFEHELDAELGEVLDSVVVLVLLLLALLLDPLANLFGDLVHLVDRLPGLVLAADVLGLLVQSDALSLLQDHSLELEAPENLLLGGLGERFDVGVGLHEVEVVVQLYLLLVPGSVLRIRQTELEERLELVRRVERGQLSTLALDEGSAERVVVGGVLETAPGCWS